VGPNLLVSAGEAWWTGRAARAEVKLAVGDFKRDGAIVQAIGFSVAPDLSACFIKSRLACNCRVLLIELLYLLGDGEEV